MKYALIAVLSIALATALSAQDAKPARVGWYIAPEIGAMFLDDHIGRSIGGSFGLKFWKNRIKVGAVVIGRPGPINPATFTTQTVNNQRYLGKTAFDLRADWATFGLTVAPCFKLNRVEINVPISFGSAAGGFYLVGDDRKTPDGARVSVWENRLFTTPELEEASAGSWTEFGVQAFFPTKIKGIQVGAGLHYTLISGWKTYNDPTGDFYNNKLRASVLVNFGSF
jgi:hypothetical protein